LRTTRQSITQLIVIVAVVIVTALATHTTDLLIVIAALVVMVMIHELGHFATAKLSHMKVTEYFFGFGPKLWSVRRGETEYGIKAIPAGGYVKILGMSNLEEVDPSEEARTYREQPFHNRLMVAFAGSAMHFVMAFLLLWGLVAFVGIPVSNTVAVSSYSLLPNGSDPARAGGLEIGDQVLRADGHALTSPAQLAQIIKAGGTKPVTLVVERGGRDLTLTITPKPDAAAHEPRIGVGLSNATATVNPITAVGHAIVDVGRATSATVVAIGSRFSPSGIGSEIHDLVSSKAATQAAKSGNRIQSIVGGVRAATQGAQAGIGDLLLVLVSINISVGLINLLPMLPFDGGHVVVAIYERIRTRRGRKYRADVTKLNPYAWGVMLVIGIVVLSAMYLDIAHPIANPFQ